MKKFLLSLCAIVLVAGSIFAQDAEASYKEASKSWKSYATAGGDEKMDLLISAAKKLDVAMDGASSLDEKKATKIYKLRGDVYNELATQSVNRSQLDPEFKIADMQASIKSFDSYKILYQTASKKYAKRDAVTGMQTAVNGMRNMGSVSFQQEDYTNSYYNFFNLSNGFDFLKENGVNSDVFPTDSEYNQNLLYAALTANAAGMQAEARPIIEKLYKEEYDDAGVYENMYKIYAEEDPEKALRILNEGREKYPESEAMLVAEINYYMSNNKLDELVGKLKKAIELDPANTSFYLALGSTYDNLTQREMKAGNKEKSEEYFDQAKKYYAETLKIEADNSTAVYSTGALYYNRAAAMLTDLIALEEKGDYSKDAMARQTAMRADILKEFENALPYFQQAEKLNPNDLNALLALKEIYARKDDFELSNVFKKRIEQLNAGETLESSYFSEK
jgi:Flp pilus assembly protein TadD, contains TPR repeats